VGLHTSSIRRTSSHSARLIHTTAIYNSFRPQNTIETSHGGETIVTYSDNLKTVQLRSMQGLAGPEKDGFVFDRVFPEGTPQHELFDYGVKE